MAQRTFDAVVIGGGIIGLSAAYQIARRGMNRVAVLEKGPHVAAGSTGQSSAIVRQRYGNRELVELAYASLQMFQNWRERLELAESRCGFSPVGVVWLPDESPVDCSHALSLFQKVGAVGEVVAADEIKRRYPSMNLCNRALARSEEPHRCVDPQHVFWEPEGGYADPQGTTEDLLKAARRLGAELFVRHEVAQIDVEAAGRFRLACSNGELFSCGLVLNAAGPWCEPVNQMVGVTLPMPMRPTRVQIATRDRPPDVIGHIPVFVSAADQIYGRPEGHGQQLIVGSVAPEDEQEQVEDADNFDTSASPEFRDRMMHRLHHRFAMKSRGTVRGYAALYTVNTSDWHPIIDAVGPDGYFVAGGFSGHGFKLGPSVGALIGQLMTGTPMPDDPSTDIRFFAADRKPIASGGGVLA